MDISQLAQTAITAILPFLTKGGEAMAQESGKSLFQWIKNLLTQKNKQKELDPLKNEADQFRQQGRLEMTLEDILREQPDLCNELKTLLENHQPIAANTYNKNINNGTIQDVRDVRLGDNYN